MIDTTFTAVGLEIAVPSAEELETGSEPEIQVRVTSAIMMPVIDPSAGAMIGQIPVPFGRYSFTIGDPDEAEKFFEHGLELARTMPRRRAASDLAVVSSMAEAEQTRKRLNKLGLSN